MIISREAEKAFEKIQHPFMIKALQKMGIEGTYLNIVKAIYDKLIANIILRGEKLKVFALRSGTRQGCPLSPLLFKHSSGSPCYSNQRRKRNKRNPDQKREVKFSLFADDTILYMLLLILSRFSHVRLCATPQTASHQAPPSLGFSRQEH